MKNTIVFSLIIPLHNEEDNVPQLLDELSLEFAGRRDVEVILVDDGSEDTTRVIIDSAMPSSLKPIVRVLEIKGRHGQAFALSKGFNSAKGQFLVRMDGDLQDHPRDAQRIMNELASGHDLVVGLRSIRAHSRWNRVQSMLFDVLAVSILGSPFHSSVASMAGFEANLLKHEKLGPQSNRYLVLIALRNGAQSPSEIFVGHRPRRFGESKYGKTKKLVYGAVGSAVFLVNELIRKSRP